MRRATLRAVLASAVFVTVSLAGPGATPLHAQQEGIPGAAQPTDDARQARLDAETARIGATLRCPICRQQSVAESSSELARSMQSIIREKLVAGETPEEIEAYFVASYGEWILLQPKARGVNLLVYILPVATFLLGGLLIAARFRRQRGLAAPHVGTQATDSAGPAPPESDGASVEDGDRVWLAAAIRGDS